MEKNNQKKLKVVVGLSGGIDSAVAAKLLQEKDFDVVGVHLKLWNEKKDILKKREELVKKITKKLKIPLIIVNAQQEFLNYTIKQFLNELKRGRTPNPCVDCNYFVKFSLLDKIAKKIKAKYLATGHYARIKKENGIFYLLKGKDNEKDQSYFLWRLNQKLLKKIIFPLGEFQKNEVKKMAEFWGLNFKKNYSESQDLCFVNNLEKFIEQKLKKQTGAIIDLTTNKIIGKHPGVYFFTIGQRKNIRVPGPEPYYVIKKDAKKNLLFVAPASAKKSFQNNYCQLEKVNFILPQIKLPLRCGVKIRYKTKMLPATLYKKDGAYFLQFKKPVQFLTPGQSAVFYQKDKVIGGGVIK
ncbi:MAG: tRNA 2-thiouridine(34) synthase MnmA [Minisyncoccia bacterium]